VLSLVLYALLALVVIAAIFMILTRVLPAGEQIAAPVRDDPIWSLPPGRGLTSEDVATVRLPVALRGYRFAETDQLLDRLADELRQRDEEIARLRTAAPVVPTPSEAAPPAGAPPTEVDPPAPDHD
jgi:DivIVA domain-containing protein